MNNQHIEAQIIEIGGGPDLKPYFNVALRAIPHVGDLIHLYSLVDEAAKKQTDYFYEVVRVLHKLFDVPENLNRDSRQAIVAGSHGVSIFVKRSTSDFFN